MKYIYIIIQRQNHFLYYPSEIAVSIYITLYI